MKNLKINFKSIVRSKARWLLTLIAILTIGVGQMWAAGITNINYVSITGSFNSWANGGNSAWWFTPNPSSGTENHYTGTFYLPYSSSNREMRIYLGRNNDGNGNWGGSYAFGGYWLNNDTWYNSSMSTSASNDQLVAYSSSPASGYIKLECEFYGEYSGNPRLKIKQSAVDALSLTSLGASSSSVKSGQSITMSPTGAAGGSGSYSYSYSSSLGGSFDGNTFTAPYYFNSPSTTITVTMSDAHTLLSGLATVQKTKSITINRPDNMYVKTQFNDWADWGWMTMSSNGDGTYSNTGEYKASTGCNWSVTNNDGSAPFIAAGSITLVPNDGNWHDGDDCTLKLTPTSWVGTKSATASFIRRISVTASRVTLDGGTGAASTPTISATSYSNGKVDYNTSVTFTAPNATTGYTWVGWFTNSEGTGTAHTTNKSFTETVTTGKTYYAIYRQNTYTVNVSAAGEHGTITTGSPSVTAGVATNPTITAATYGTNKDQYRFWKWTCTGGASVASETSATTTVSATGTGTVTANFVSVWCLKGGDTSGSNGSDAMGDWQTLNSMDYTGTSYVYRLTIPLAANTTYQFKLYDFPNSSEYRYGDSNYQLAYVGQSSAYNHNLESTANKQNLVIMTAKAGTYTFTWNSSTKRLTVGFPSQTHPNSNNIYFKNSGGSAYSSVNAHIWNGTASTGFYRLPTLPTCTFAGETYYYAAIGDNTKCLFADGEVNPGTKTADQTSVNEKKGKYYDLSSGTWKDFTVSVNLNNQSATTAGASSVTATYNAAMPSIAADKPAKTGYTWGGYFKEVAGGSTQYYSNTGASAHVWDQTGASPSIYAKWTQNITLNQNGATTSGSTSLAATYNAVLDASGITNPSRTNYTFAGWTNGEGGTGTVVINTSKVVQTVESWTDGSKKWIHDDVSILYAKWTENLHNVAVVAGDHGSVSVDEVTGVGIATASSEITAVPDEGYHFVNWTGDINDGVTIASGSPSSETITINATADGKTITANFAANSYSVAFHANYPSGNRFNNSGSMSNQGFTYDAAQSLTANAFACEGYNFLGWSASSSATSATYTNSQSVSNLTSTNGATFDLYAVWGDNNTYYFDGGTSGTNTAWGTAANWTKGAAPSDMDNHTVIILKPAQVTADAAVKVKNVRIANAGSYTPTNGSAITATGTLTIPATGALVVQEGIKNYNVSSEAESSTTWRTLHILSSSSGTGALVTGGRVEHDTASVSFYTKACQPSVGKYVNQFFGIPFSSSSVNNYYGVYLYKHDAATNAFTPSSSATMTAFTAYLMLRTDLSPATLYMEGELLLPGTSDTYKGKDLSLIGASGKKVSNMFANSWTAPIDLRAMTSADFDGVEATFYLFNAGKSDDTNAGKAGDGAGQWTVLPVEAIKADWSADSDLDDYPQYVLPSQQAFLVVATTDEDDATHTLKLDYKKHVYNPAVANGVTIEPTRAPRRDDFVLPEQINLYATGASGNSDRVIIYAREDFSTGFDNGWEGYKINGSNFAPQMYTLGDNGKMAINAIPDVEGSVIGFKPGTEDVQYTFTFKYRGENTWYLNDLKEQTSTLIDELDSYTFTSAEGDMEARFIISRTPIAYMPTGIDNGGGAVEGVSVRKLMIDGKLYIIRNGQMFTAEGQMVK